MAARKAETPDLVTLLDGALAGTDAALWRWYRALAEASPLWALQRHAYERRGWFRPDDTAAQWSVDAPGRRGSVTPWVVMTHTPWSEWPVSPEISAHRMLLETIATINSPRDFNPLAPALPIWKQRGEDLAKASRAASAAVAFVLRGSPKDERSRVRKAVGLQVRSGPRGLGSTESAALVRDAKALLAAIRECLNRERGRSPDNPFNVRRWRIALPMLDGTEAAYLHTSDAQRSWRSTAVFMVQRRLEPFRFIAATTLYEYTFGRGQAGLFRQRHASNPLEPAAPSLQS